MKFLPQPPDKELEESRQKPWEVIKVPSLDPVRRHLVPLRSPRDPDGKDVPSLLQHSQDCHPHEARIRPSILDYPAPNRVRLQYAYKGETVRITVVVPSIDDEPGILEQQTISASAFGALALEQAFGHKPTDEELFTSDSGGFAGSLGPVYGDIEGALIMAETPGGVLITMQGTYLAEAGIYLTQAWRVIKELMDQVQEGIQSIHLCFPAGVCNAVVASPVKMTIGVHNLDKLGNSSAAEFLTKAFNKALQNKTTGQTPS